MHVIATAGHVDHGKSTLVRALTGMEPDRWEEERRRGLTIDLGYAWTRLDDGTDLAFVDVPGHERFVTNMLAGVGPVPAALLVVAADGGWSVQTAEHASALDALGVRHGLLVVTRADLADPAPALAEARQELAASTLAGVEALAVSAVTGAGMDGLRAALGRLVATLPRPEERPARLWIDRVFTIRGAGTVVTGTLSSGTIAAGDTLVTPGAGEMRVRTVESLKRPVERATAVARVALNVRSGTRGELRRGDALLAPGRWRVATTFDVRLVRPPDRLPAELTLHAGSASVPVRLRRLSPSSARLHLAGGLALHVGEAGLVREPGTRTLAGFRVLDLDPPPIARGGSAALGARLEALGECPTAAQLVAHRGAIPMADLDAFGAGSPGDGAVEAGGWYVQPDRWETWSAQARIYLDGWAADHPRSPGVPAAQLAAALGLPAASIVERWCIPGSDLVADDLGVHRAAVTAGLPSATAARLGTVLARLADSPFDAPSAPDLADLGLGPDDLAVAVRSGILLKLAEGVYLAPPAIDEALRRLAALDQPFTASAARQALDTSRRVAIPLLELLDRTRRTVRVDQLTRRVVQRAIADG